MRIKLLSNKTFHLQGILFFSFLIFYSLFSCKKEIPFAEYESSNIEKLTGDTSVFVGTWAWVYTDHYFGWCDNQSYYEYLDSASENLQFQLQFFESGYVYYYKDFELVSSYRISIQYIENIVPGGCTNFAIDMDGFDDLSLSGCIKEDTIKAYIPGFLFYAEDGCESYVNYFVKE